MRRPRRNFIKAALDAKERSEWLLRRREEGWNDRFAVDGSSVLNFNTYNTAGRHPNHHRYRPCAQRRDRAHRRARSLDTSPDRGAPAGGGGGGGGGGSSGGSEGNQLLSSRPSAGPSEARAIGSNRGGKGTRVIRNGEARGGASKKRVRVQTNVGSSATSSPSAGVSSRSSQPLNRMVRMPLDDATMRSSPMSREAKPPPPPKNEQLDDADNHSAASSSTVPYCSGFKGNYNAGRTNQGRSAPVSYGSPSSRVAELESPRHATRVQNRGNDARTIDAARSAATAACMCREQMLVQLATLVARWPFEHSSVGASGDPAVARRKTKKVASPKRSRAKKGKGVAAEAAAATATSTSMSQFAPEPGTAAGELKQEEHREEHQGDRGGGAVQSLRQSGSDLGKALLRKMAAGARIGKKQAKAVRIGGGDGIEASAPRSVSKAEAAAISEMRPEAARNLTHLADELREAGLRCSEKIVAWSLAVDPDAARPTPFEWNGQNYLVKMHTDLDFVTATLGRDARDFGIGNPLLLTRSEVKARANGHLAKLNAATYVILDAVARERKSENEKRRASNLRPAAVDKKRKLKAEGEPDTRVKWEDVEEGEGEQS